MGALGTLENIINLGILNEFAVKLAIEVLASFKVQFWLSLCGHGTSMLHDVAMGLSRNEPST